MAWSGVKTVVAGEPILIEDHNAYVNNNLLYLLTPNHFYVYDASSAYTTTSLSYTNVNAALAKSITMYGGHLLVGVHGSLSTGNAAIEADLSVAIDGADDILIARIGNGFAGDKVQACLLIPSTVIAAGAHTVSLRFKTGNASYAAGFAGNANPPIIFWGVEV